MIAFRIYDERCVVRWSIVLSRAWGAIVFSSGGKRADVKLSHSLPALSGEGKMKAWHIDWTLPINLLDCELVPTSRQAVANSLTFLSRAQIAPNSFIAQRRER